MSFIWLILCCYSEIFKYEKIESYDLNLGKNMVYIEVEIHDLYYMQRKENTNIDICGLFFHIWNWNIKSTDPYTTEIRKTSTPCKKKKIKTTKIFNKRMGYYFVCPYTISWLECIVSPDPC